MMKSRRIVLVLVALVFLGLGVENVQAADEPFFKNVDRVERLSAKGMEASFRVFMIPVFPITQVAGAVGATLSWGLGVTAVPFAAVSDLVAAPFRGKSPSKKKRNRRGRRGSGR